MSETARRGADFCSCLNAGACPPVLAAWRWQSWTTGLSSADGPVLSHMCCWWPSTCSAAPSFWGWTQTRGGECLIYPPSLRYFARFMVSRDQLREIFLCTFPTLFLPPVVIRRWVCVMLVLHLCVFGGWRICIMMLQLCSGAAVLNGTNVKILSQYLLWLSSKWHIMAGCCGGFRGPQLSTLVPKLKLKLSVPLGEKCD